MALECNRIWCVVCCSVLCCGCGSVCVCLGVCMYVEGEQEDSRPSSDAATLQSALRDLKISLISTLA